MDDVFSITKKTTTERLLLAHINNIDTNIRFTMKREEEQLFLILKLSGRMKG